MSEYIKREDAKRAILDRENHSMIHDYEFNNGLIDACNAIDDVPSADVIEGVSCKHCIYEYVCNHTISMLGPGIAYECDVEVSGCSVGKSREDEDNE